MTDQNSKPKFAVPIFITLVYALCLGTLIGNAAAFGFNIFAMARSSDYVESTLNVLASLKTLQSLAVDAESAQRGYLLTGDKTYLEPYTAAKRNFAPAADRLRSLIADSPVQQANLAQLQSLIAAKIAEMDTTITVREREGAQVAVALVYTDVGRNTMTQIRGLVATMEAEQNRLLAGHAAEAERMTRVSVITAVASSLLAIVVVMLFYMLIRRNLARRLDAEEALRTANANLSTLVDDKTAQLTNLSRYLISVREEEKAKLARELHDELGSSLTALNMDVAWVNEKVRPDFPDYSRRLDRALATLHATVDLKRRIIEDLRPSMLDSLGLTAAMQSHCEDFTRRTGLPCAAEVADDLGEVDPEHAIALFRIAQEALTNTSKYAQAKAARMALLRNNGGITLLVEDDGVGIPDDAWKKPKTHGLLGMRERVNHLGGTLAIRRGPGDRGTIIEVFLPLTVTASEATAALAAPP